MRALVLAGVAAAGWATAARAAPSLGDAVTCTSTGYLACSAGSATVGNGVEFDAAAGSYQNVLSIDFSENTLTISNNLGRFIALSGSGLSLSFTDATNAFTQAILVDNSGVEGIDQSKLSISNAGDVTINFSDTDELYSNSFFTVSLGATPVAVPEPASLVLLSVGLVSLAAARRRYGSV